MRLRIPTLAVSLLALLAVAGCGDKGINRIPAASNISLGTVPTTSTSTTLPPTTVAASPLPGTPHAIGDVVTTATGNTVTVHAWNPAPANVPATVAGGSAGAADVEVCAPKAPTVVDPTNFQLRVSDGTDLAAVTSGGVQPPLASATVARGACKRGWLTFSLPPGTAGTELVFRGSSVIRWSLT